MRQIAQATVATQFEVIPAAAEDCDVLVAGGALQIALRSVAELRGIPYA
jgi:vancomycin aglycone glucosyltransferase